MSDNKTNIRSKITYEDTYNGLEINTNRGKKHGCYTQVLERLDAHLNDMTENHSKVMQVRFDLRYPTDGSVVPNKEHLSDFNENLSRKLKREQYTGGHKVDPRITLVPEKHHGSHPHIHGVILVNGNAYRDHFSLLKKIEKSWSTTIKSDATGLVHYCDQQGSNGIIIDRNSVDFHNQMNDCIYQASYLAKARGKDNNPKGSWLSMGTRIPKR